jgi:hypothetical protein
MRIICQSTLADALAAWGKHEATGRLQRQLSVANPDKLTSLNVVLQYRAPFVARILLRDAVQALEVELEASDGENIVLADTRSLSGWIDKVRSAGGDSLEYFERLVASVDPPRGPFFAAATQPSPNEIDELIVYDGWHRLSAWYQRVREGRPSTIQGFLVIVRFADPLMSKAA